MTERHYMALIRSKAPWTHRRQELIEATFYEDEPPTAEEVARALCSTAQGRFQCAARFLIVDKVV